MCRAWPVPVLVPVLVLVPPEVLVLVPPEVLVLVPPEVLALIIRRRFRDWAPVLWAGRQHRSDPGS